MEEKNFNRWTILEEAGSDRWGNKLLKCQCLCGVIRTVTATTIRNNRSKSCNCLQKEIVRKRMGLPEGISERNRKFRTYKRKAKEKDIEFSLDIDTFVKITSSNCFYCGTLPLPYAKEKQSNGAFIGNGLDRVDNSKGYILDNVVPCCTQCNWAKNVQSQEEFYSWALRFYNHYKEKFT